MNSLRMRIEVDGKFGPHRLTSYETVDISVDVTPDPKNSRRILTIDWTNKDRNEQVRIPLYPDQRDWLVAQLTRKPGV